MRTQLTLFGKPFFIRLKGSRKSYELARFDVTRTDGSHPSKVAIDVSRTPQIF